MNRFAQIGKAEGIRSRCIRGVLRCSSLTLLCLLSFSPASVRAQEALSIQGVDIPIGMNRTAVIDALKQHRLTCPSEKELALSSCESVLVTSKFPPHEAYANVVLKDGRVRSIRKYWSAGYDGTDPSKFVQTFIGLVAKATTAGPKQFLVSVSEIREPGTIQQTVFLRSGSRVLSISLAEGLRDSDGKIIPTFVNLDEMID